VIVATSGDTGGAVAAALHGLKQVSNIILYPRGNISAQQRRQLTTLKAIFTLLKSTATLMSARRLRNGCWGPGFCQRTV